MATNYAAARYVQPYRYGSPNIPLSAIRRFARQIGERFHPDKIILFGSYAYGTPHNESDVDLLVIMPANDVVAQAIRITGAFKRQFSHSIIVRTDRQVQRGLKQNNWFLREVMAKGKVLFRLGLPPEFAQAYFDREDSAPRRRAISAVGKPASNSMSRASSSAGVQTRPARGLSFRQFGQLDSNGTEAGAVRVDMAFRRCCSHATSLHLTRLAASRRCSAVVFNSAITLRAAARLTRRWQNAHNVAKASGGDSQGSLPAW